MGYKFPIIFIPFLLISFFDTLGWQFSFNHWLEGIKLKHLFPVRWAGEAINVLTPTAYVGGEPVKAYILKRYGVSLQDGLASVIVGKTVMTMAQVIFLVFGIIAATNFFSPDSYLILTVFIAVIISIPLMYGFFVWQKKGLFTSVSNLLHRFKFKIEFLIKNKEKIESLDGKIRYFYRYRKKRFYISLMYYFLGWMAGLIEVYTILYLLGQEVTFLQALTIESIIQLLKSCSFFIPASLGVIEGGGIIVFTAIGLSAETGLAYTIFRRLRELIWAGMGLGVLMLYGGSKNMVNVKETKQAERLPLTEQ